MIGVWGANYYAQHGGHVFATDDRDFFFPPDPENLLTAWIVSRELGFELWSGNEPLGAPLDLWLAKRVVSNRANTTAIHPSGIIIDFTSSWPDLNSTTCGANERSFASMTSRSPSRASHTSLNRKQRPTA